jgi:oligopeptidase A
MIMTNCSHRGLRERLYKAYAHRASRYDENGPAYDNAAVAVSILNLRREEAALLGYPEYAQYALSKRFAHTPESVSTFLKQLIIAIKPKAEKEFIKIKTLAINDGLTEIEPWDVAFYSEQLKKQELSIHDEEIREYFTLDRVLPLMLETFGDMYGFKTRQEHFPSWHKDVISLSLLNNKTQDPIGVLYIDLYARNGKRQGAWMSGAGSKVDYKSWKALPVAYIVCNFRKDDEGTLSFDDLQTLFHEFGHSLHHLLTQRTLPSIAGINQVPWDIVELPSQLSEQWCFEKSFLKKLSAHRDTKQPLSDDLINNLIKTRQFMASLFLLRQLEFASFDWGIHGKDHINDVVGYWHEIRRDIAVTPSIATHAFPLSFSHIFDGGYAAGYYSYLWADAYVYQVYEKMKAYKTMHSAGTAFKEKFLTIGPSLSLQESLHEFLGEEQSIKPFLKAYGI